MSRGPTAREKKEIRILAKASAEALVATEMFMRERLEAKEAASR